MQDGVIETSTPLPPLNPLALIQQAIAAGMDPDKLGKLMELEERWTRNRAAETFAGAITAFQRECPQIEKVKNVDGKYNYAPYDHLMRIVGPIMAKHNIVATFSIENQERQVTITCRVRVGIHQEVTTLAVPVPDGNRLVNNTQLMGQAISYAKRYSLAAALNIVTREEDKDGMDLTDTIDGAEAQQLRNMIRDKGGAEELFLDYASKQAGTRIETFEQIPAGIFPKLLDGLKRVTPKEGSPAAIRAAEQKKGGK